MSLISIFFFDRVGRIDLEDFESAQDVSEIELQGLLRSAFGKGISLVYIFSPFIMKDGKYINLTNSTLPGIKVDEKTTYKISLSSLNMDKLIKESFSTAGIKVSSYVNSEPSEELKTLAISAGEWSRFKTDSNLPRNSLDLMYNAWLKNSVNRTLADEVFVAVDSATNQTVGLITLKGLKDQLGVSIGLLAVSSAFRRRGIASALLSRAALWSSERTQWSPNGYISVVTQGENKPACLCYERFGFVKDLVQNIYHAWLPQHLEEPSQRADHAPVPFCKQHLTGKEKEYVSQVFAAGLDSAARFTVLCSSGLREILGPDSERVVIVPSGTAALEMAALLIDLKPGDEVIMPSYTFSSTANAVVLRGAVPVFIDSREDTLNMDERLIEGAITSRTVAIYCVHYGGVPCEMDTICEIAKRRNLYVVEDNAQGSSIVFIPHIVSYSNSNCFVVIVNFAIFIENRIFIDLQGTTTGYHRRLWVFLLPLHKERHLRGGWRHFNQSIRHREDGATSTRVVGKRYKSVRLYGRKNRQVRMDRCGVFVCTQRDLLRNSLGSVGAVSYDNRRAASQLQYVPRRTPIARTSRILQTIERT